MVIPNNLEEAVTYLYSIMTDEDKRIIAKTRHWPSVAHHGLGRNLRNDWGLWTNSHLAQWFESEYGLQHADDMSGIILKELHSRITNQPFNIPAQVERYKQHWLKYS